MEGEKISSDQAKPVPVLAKIIATTFLLIGILIFVGSFIIGMFPDGPFLWQVFLISILLVITSFKILRLSLSKSIGYILVSVGIILWIRTIMLIIVVLSPTPNAVLNLSGILITTITTIVIGYILIRTGLKLLSKIESPTIRKRFS